MRRIWTGLAVAVLMTACGGESMTVPEYAAEVEALVAEMVASFTSLDARWESQAPTVEGAQRYWDRRMQIREEFLAGIEAIDPPAGVADMHATALDVFTRMTAADEAIAARVATYDSISEHWPWISTPEGEASLAILDEVYAFCRSSQEEFDETARREALEGTPWVPAEMREVVRVAFGCPPQE